MSCADLQAVNRVGLTRVIRLMSEFATLASPYSMPVAPHGDVDLSDSSANARARGRRYCIQGCYLFLHKGKNEQKGKIDSAGTTV